MAPRVTPAARTIDSVGTPAKPDAANSGRAARISASFVAADRAACVLGLSFIQTVRMLVPARPEPTARSQPMPTVDLPQGTVHYRVAGPADSTSPPVVFVHGILVNGELWTAAAE